MFNITKLFTVALSCIATSACTGETPSISQQQLLTALKETNNNIVILDVRTEDEYNQGHIEGAMNISHELIEKNLSKLSQYKNSTIVLYCRSGRRVGIAKSILDKNGFKDLRHLAGDMNGWIEAKLPVVSNKHSH